MSLILCLGLISCAFGQTQKSQSVVPPMDWAGVDTLYFHRNAGDNLERSIATLKNWIVKYPDDAEALWRLGRSLEKLGEKEKNKRKKLSDFGEAETALKRSVGLEPAIADAHFFLGVTWGRIGQTRGIFKSLFLVGPIKDEMHKTLEIDPNYSGAHHVLGEIMRQTPRFAGGSKKGAIRELETAFELQPEYTGIYTDLAEAYLDVGDKEKAKAVLKKIFDVKNPSDPADYPDDMKLAQEMLSKLGEK